MKKKSEIISRIAKNLEQFYPEYPDHFMCPTCLEVIGLNELSEISEAHIVPKAAGGSLKTYLCRSCNSRFGSLQDKWAGEYIRLKDNKLTPMHTSMQKGYFEVDGIRLSGEFRVGPNNSLEFYVWKDKSPPESIERFLGRTNGNEGEGVKSITVPMPLFEYKAEMDVGFLTAAYLLWFKELGYSWVLQNHLNDVRRQIQYPSDKILQHRYLGLTPDKYFSKPWIGVAKVNDELTLVAGIADRLIFLPVADREDFYHSLGGDFDGANCSILQEFHFSEGHRWGGPVGILYRDRLVVMSDLILNQVPDHGILMFEEGKFLPVLARPISEEDFERQKQLPDTHYIQVKERVRVSAEIERPPRPKSMRAKKT